MNKEFVLGLPSTEVLYDKVINVDLIRTIPNNQIFVVLGTQEESGKTTKELSVAQWTDQGMLRTYDKKVLNCIAIYNGKTHREYYKDENDIVKSRVVSPSGSTVAITYKDRWWTDESIVKDIKKAIGDEEDSGCLITVNNEGTIDRFHAMYLKEDEINTRDYIAEDRIEIRCPEGGMKPSIAFSTNLIPGANCYKMTLKIYNMNLDFDVREINRVEVVAGYRLVDEFMFRFSCPVFSSYIESPNPDGVTVFECLAVGRTSAFIKNKPVELNYLGGTITIHEFLGAIARGLDLQLHDYLLEDYQKLPLNMRKMGTFAENGTAVINWARTIIQNRIAISEGAPEKSVDLYNYSRPYIYVSVTQDTLVVYAINRRNQDTESESATIINLDAVKGASFNGVALTVKAAWNPYMQPGSVFQMQPNIINGANLPNTVQNTTYGKDEENQYLYRCITMSISFSTNGNENEMSILAVPIKYLDTSDSFTSEITKTIGEFAQDVYKNFSSEGGYTINFGSSDGKEVAETEEFKKQKVVTTNTNNMFDLDIGNTFGTTRAYQIVDGDNLSTLASKWFATEGAPDGNKYCDFPLDVSKEKADELPPGAYRNVIPKVALWPIIAVLTYRKWKEEGEDKPAHRFESMDRLANPDSIRTGKYLMIPVIESMDQLAQCREVFKYACAAYESGFPAYGEWVRYWKALYQYLGGTW